MVLVFLWNRVFYCSVTGLAQIEPADLGRIIVAHEYRARVESRAERIGGIRNLFITGEIQTCICQSEMDI